MNIVKNHHSAIIVISIAIIFILNVSTVGGYTETIGVERNDVIDIEYTGRTRDDDVVFDSGRILEAKVDSEIWIRGFYNGLLGMKEDTDKTITVQPADGYTDPTDKLYNRVLIFEVHLYKVVKNVRETPSSESGIFNSIWTGIKWVAGIGTFIFVVFTLNQYRVQNISSMCVHCDSLGRKTTSDGNCGKCGNLYCRASFSKGCPNCRANSFIPKR